MKISVVTLFPKMIECFLNESILKRAQKLNLVQFELVNLRKFALDDYGTVDDKPYGGGPGMVLRVDVVKKALDSIKGDRAYTLLTSAKGARFTQEKAKEYSKKKNIIIITGHYEGVDERVRAFVDEEASLGDFVLTGGEIVAAAMIDAIVRLIPSVINKESLSEESFFSVKIDELIDIVGVDSVLSKLKKQGVKKVRLLEYPHYTRPEKFAKKRAPKVLLSGNHKEIRKWRLKEAYKKTLNQRSDLLLG